MLLLQGTALWSQKFSVCKEQNVCLAKPGPEELGTVRFSLGIGMNNLTFGP
jgi:hypothetical protein